MRELSIDARNFHALCVKSAHAVTRCYSRGKLTEIASDSPQRVTIQFDPSRSPTDWAMCDLSLQCSATLFAIQIS